MVKTLEDVKAEDMVRIEAKPGILCDFCRITCGDDAPEAEWKSAEFVRNIPNTILDRYYFLCGECYWESLDLNSIPAPIDTTMNRLELLWDHADEEWPLSKALADITAKIGENEPIRLNFDTESGRLKIERFACEKNQVNFKEKRQADIHARPYTEAIVDMEPGEYIKLIIHRKQLEGKREMKSYVDKGEVSRNR